MIEGEYTHGHLSGSLLVISSHSEYALKSVLNGMTNE